MNVGERATIGVGKRQRLDFAIRSGFAQVPVTFGKVLDQAGTRRIHDLAIFDLIAMTIMQRVERDVMSDTMRHHDEALRAVDERKCRLQEHAVEALEQATRIGGERS
jgi:hypothetical protein